MRTDGWTDIHDEANSRFSRFCECTRKQTVQVQTGLPYLNEQRHENFMISSATVSI